MITQTITLAISSLLLFQSCGPKTTLHDLECAEFQSRAADPDEDALALLATYPADGCAPAERFVLAVRALDEGLPIAKLLLLQGRREHRHRAHGLVNLIAQVDLLVHLARRGLVSLPLARVESLAQRADALIGIPDPDVAPLFAEYDRLASAALRSSPRGPCRTRRARAPNLWRGGCG